MAALTQVGAFCPNPECADYGQVQTDHPASIIRFGFSKAGHQRYQCKTCGQTFTETKGTLFYRRRASESEILKALAQIAEGSRISSVSRTTGHKEDTLLAWLREAARKLKPSKTSCWPTIKSRAANWTVCGLMSEQGKKDYPETAETGQFWRSTMIDMDARLRVARGIAKTETEASRTVFQTLKDRGHPDAPPPTMSMAGVGSAKR